MNILSSKLLVQALTQRAQAKLPRRERTRRLVSAPARRRTREDQCTALTCRVELVSFEHGDREPRERECSTDVGVERLRDFLVRGLKERLPDGVARIKDSHTKRVRRGRPELLDRGEG